MNSYQIVFLGLGGNLGNIQANLQQALILLQKVVGDLVAQSSIYQTKAWGRTEQPDFLNQVLCFKTQLSANELLTSIQEIETLLGRKREEHWGARTMDIDILFYGQECIHTPDLSVPHPYITQRRFVLVPLVEIAADWLHPQTQKTMLELLCECDDNLEVNYLAK
jgi:2-amino-4-hydroxy-6-hydroxymethyldihydropteridine diphosphokinase